MSQLQHIHPKPPVDKSSDLTKSLPEFTVFDRLPLELRTMIWGYAARKERRKIKIFLRKIASDEWHSQFVDQSRHPGLMHATRESRAVGSKYYSLCHEKKQSRNDDHEFGIADVGNDSARPWLNIRGNAIFINFELDVFVIFIKETSDLGILTECNFAGRGCATNPAPPPNP